MQEAAEQERIKAEAAALDEAVERKRAEAREKVAARKGRRRATTAGRREMNASRQQKKRQENRRWQLRKRVRRPPAGRGASKKPDAERKTRKDAAGKDTKYGRKQLHVTAGKGGRRKKKARPSRRVTIESTGEHGFERPTATVVHEVAIPENILVSELARKMSVKAAEIIKVLMQMGVMAAINQSLDQDTATLVVEEMGHVAKPAQENALEEELKQQVRKCPVSDCRVRRWSLSWVTSITARPRCWIISGAPRWPMPRRVVLPSILAPITWKHQKGMISFLDTPGTCRIYRHARARCRGHRYCYPGGCRR